MEKNSAKWYRMQATDDVGEITIFGDIGGGGFFSFGITPADFKEDFDMIKDKKEIKVLIDSPGGNAFAGVAIMNIIATQREKVSVEIMGLAASAASIVALGGNDSKRIMHEGSFFMIHNPTTFARGGAEDLRKIAEDLDKVTEQLVNIYQAHSNLLRDEITEAMDDVTWYSADDAKEAGFIDDIEEDADIAAHAYDLGKYAYAHVPEGIRGAQNITEKPATRREFERFLRDSGSYSKTESVAIASHGFDFDRRESEQEADRPEVGEDGGYIVRAGEAEAILAALKKSHPENPKRISDGRKVEILELINKRN